MTIDVHHHYAPPALAAYLRATARGSDAAAALAASYLPSLPALTGVQSRLVEMDACGIELAVLSAPPVGLDRVLAARPEVSELISRCNDELTAVAAAHPDRFAAMITLPFPDPAACLAELNRLAGNPQVQAVVRAVIVPARGFTEHPMLDDPGYEPVLAALGVAGWPLLLHPAFEPVPEPFAPWRLDTALAAPTATSLVAARLMLSGTLDRVGDLTLIVPHLGGVLPYLLGRMVDQCGRGAAAHDVAWYLRHRVLLDTCSFHPPALSCALDSVGEGRIMFGSDFPFRGPMARAVADITSAELSAPQRAAILHDTATRELGLGRSQN